MGKSKIEWTHETWNPVIGCRRVSPGCEHCYAETMAGRIARMGGPAAERYLRVVKLDEDGKGRGRWNGRFEFVPEALVAPLRWRTPRRVFVNSMSDLFGEGVTDEEIAAVFGVMAVTPQHTYQILTKRADRMEAWFDWITKQTPDPWTECHYQALRRDDEEETIHRRSGDGGTRPWPLPNVWIGVSVEDQQRADERIPHLLRTPAEVRFLSVEPLLGPIEFSDVTRRADAVAQLGKKALDGVGWVIVGGESGHGARPMHPDWARSLRDQCVAAGVPFFFKQWGHHAPFVDESRYTHGGAEDKHHVWLMPDGTDGYCWISDGDGLWSNWTGEPPEDDARMAIMAPIGKKLAGRLLDGREWNQYPAVPK